jgi:hypothetical protein
MRFGLGPPLSSGALPALVVALAAGPTIGCPKDPAPMPAYRRIAVADSSDWNERQEKRMPMLFSLTIGAAISAHYWFLWVRCPACRSTSSIDLRRLDRHPNAAVSSLLPALSCRSCRPNAPFAELVRLSQTSIADEMREEHRRRVLGE